MHALLFQSHLSIAITSKFTLWSLLLHTWSTYTIHLANQSCRQYPVDWLTQNYTLFRTGYIISFPRGRNLFHMQHKILISHLLPCSHRSCMSVYLFYVWFCFVVIHGPLFFFKASKDHVQSYNWKIIGGSVWPGLWKDQATNMSFVTGKI